jgi:hypothetical protein
MTKINLGSMWKIAKNPNGGGHIIRSATAVHTSANVKAQNRKLAEAAVSCKGKDRAAFRACVAEKIRK